MGCRELPAELWHHIIDFVDMFDHRNSKLYEVNRFFLQRSLDYSYRVVSLPDWQAYKSAKIARKRVLHLLQPYITERIRYLHLNSYGFRNMVSPSAKRRSRRFRFASIFPSSLGARFEPNSMLRSPDIFELCRQLISQLPSSTTFLSITTILYLTQEFLDLAVFAWKTLAGRMCNLSIQSSWRAFVYLFKETSVALPCLEDLHLSDLGFEEPTNHYRFQDDPNAEQHCAAFFEALPPSLRRLSIAIHKEPLSHSPIVLFRVLESLRVVPPLQSLSVVGTNCTAAILGRSLTRFIKRTGPSLKQLTIGPYSFTGPMASMFFCPNIRSLIIGNHPCTTVPANIDPAVAYLSIASAYIRCYRHIVVLTMTDFPVFHSELCYFLHIHPSLSGLRSLRICALSFNPQLLLFLANTLPNLLQLVLFPNLIISNASLETTECISRWGYHAFGDPQYVQWLSNTHPDWYPPFRDHDPITWGLENLQLCWPFDPRHLPVMDSELGSALRRMIPSLQYFWNTTSY